VTQEALRNCEKHSRATRVDVRLSLAGGWLRVRIEDDGIGFPPAGRRVPSQLGLLGMRERAAALGGTLTAGNRPGGGAEIELMVPVGTADAAPPEVAEARA
jgi:signal transduction histidine kinase